MHLSAILCAMFRPLPHGFKYRGKNRAIKQIKLADYRNLRKDYELTEKNMLYLRHPYLSVEQSSCQELLTKSEQRREEIRKNYELRNKRFERHINLAERLIHLKVNEAWE